jgi:hypothetical protein
MTRMHWMAFKMFSPALICLLFAFVSTGLLLTLGQSQYLVQLADTLRWLPYGLLGLAVLLGIVASVRLLRWETGGALICTCGGLLGREREGRFGPYRKCLACGRNHANRC